MEQQFKFMLEEGAFKPTKGHPTDAGFDLYTPTDFKLNPGQSKSINTGVHMFIEPGYVGLLLNKSGLAHKSNVESAVGVVDADYTGTIHAKIWNHSAIPVKFAKGDKITQIVILPIPEVTLMMTEEMPETERGLNGFGSTGR